MHIEDEGNDEDAECAAPDHDEDESFFELLKTFSTLDIPQTSIEQVEQCPLCPKTFPLDDFATHMYQCIKQLDEVRTTTALC